MPQALVDAAATHAGVDLDTGEREARGHAHDRVPGMVQLQLVHVLGPGTSAGARASRFVPRVAGTDGRDAMRSCTTRTISV